MSGLLGRKKKNRFVGFAWSKNLERGRIKLELNPHPYPPPFSSHPTFSRLTTLSSHHFLFFFCFRLHHHLFLLTHAKRHTHLILLSLHSHPPAPCLAPYDPTPTPYPGLYPTFPVLEYDELRACLECVRTRTQQPNATVSLKRTCVTDHVGVPSSPKACHIACLLSPTLSIHIPSHPRFILDSESRQIIIFPLPTYLPLTIGRVGPLGMGFICPHPYRPFALDIGSSREPSPPPRTVPWSIFP